jgi:muramoyltetrapeptide carboxypeptidase
MIIPSKLKTGDRIGIISTARKITKQELTPSINILKEWGLDIVFGKNLFKSDNQFSGNVYQRKEDLQNMIEDQTIKVILCARGGYGTVQIIDQIDFTPLIKNPKWIIGYSDVTVLHSHLNKLGLASIHATMPINFNNNTKESLESLRGVLFNSENKILTKSHVLNKYGSVEAEVVGGNLSILYSLIGSTSQINTKNKILFIEDLDEYIYHIDRMIISLKRSGLLINLKGMIIGSFIGILDNEIPFGKNIKNIILEHTKEYDYPICFDFPSGHIDNNMSILFGVNSVLDISENHVILQQ